MKKVLLLAVALVAAACVSNKDFDAYTLETQQTINALRSADANNQEQINQLVDSLEATTAALSADIAANAGNITANSEVIVDEVAAITLALEALVAADVDIQEQLDAIKTTLDDLIVEFNSEIELIKEDLELVNGNVDALEYDLDQVVEDLREEIAAAQEAAEAYADANDAVGGYNDSAIQSSLSTVSTSLTTLTTQVNTNTSNIAALTNRLDIVDGRLADVNQAIGFNSTDIRNLSTALATEISQVKGLINSNETDAILLELRVTALEGLVNTLDTVVKSIGEHTDISAVEKQLGDLWYTVKGINEAIANSATTEEVTTAVEGLEDDIDDVLRLNPIIVEFEVSFGSYDYVLYQTDGHSSWSPVNIGRRDAGTYNYGLSNGGGDPHITESVTIPSEAYIEVVVTHTLGFNWSTETVSGTTTLLASVQFPQDGVTYTFSYGSDIADDGTSATFDASGTGSNLVLTATKDGVTVTNTHSFPVEGLPENDSGSAARRAIDF